MNTRRKQGYVVHIVPGTHWDREWRLSFQETRQRLVETMDRTMDTLENDSRIPTFTLDGQVMAVEDYLELRPENRARLMKLVRTGRLAIGPWYSLPDMPVLQGESIVRNLLFGIAKADELGGALMEGFTSSSWGQISQMPQICRGFGLDTYFSYHGVPGHKYPVEFQWEGADGSRVLFIRPASASKSTFYLCEIAAVSANPDTPDRAEYGSRLLRDACRLTDLPLTDATPFFGDDTRLPFDPDILRRMYRRMRNATVKETTTRHIMMGESQDLQNMPPDIAEMVAEIARCDSTGDRIRLSSISEYFSAVKRSVGRLKVYKGEMRYPAKSARTFRLFSPLSTRIYLKQANRELENLLTHWAEPFAAFAWICGNEYPETALECAWRKMLINHSHDNIGGCSIDAVHDDMLWRFRQIGEIGRSVLRRSLCSLSRDIGAAPVEAGCSRLVVFNPLPFARSEVIEAHLDVPPSVEPRNIKVFNAYGKEVRCCVNSVSDRKVVTAELPISVCPRMKTTRVDVVLHAQDVPAMGYAEFKVACSKPAQAQKSTVECGRDWIANEHLRVVAGSDGTISLLNKSTGETFKGLHYFEDNGQDRSCDIVWNARAPRIDRLFSTRGGKAHASVLSCSPLEARLKVAYSLRVPQSLDMDHGVERDEWIISVHTSDRRSPRLIPLPVVSVFILRKGARRVDVETSIANRALDHRLRVMFPTDVQTDCSWADAPYDVVRRPAKRLDRDDWLEPRTCGVMWTNPLLSFVDVAGKGRSLAVLVDGLPEYELLKDRRRTIALTLLRAVGNGRVDRDTPVPQVHGSQCQGDYTCRYALYPHSGLWDRDGVMDEALSHNVPMKAVQALGAGSGRLPPVGGFTRFSNPGILITAAKKRNNGRGLILRLLNPTMRTMRSDLSFGFEVRSATLVDLLERPLPNARLNVRDGTTISLEIAPKKLLTLLLQVEGGLDR